MPPANHTVIVCPVYNDWQSLQILLERFQKLAEVNPSQQLSFVVVNDGSEEKQIPQTFSFPIRTIHLHRNLGHQKAIAIGLSYVNQHLPCGQVIIMDADGEDQPEDFLKLLMVSSKQPGKIIFAKRGQRRESRSYQLFYTLYKAGFRLLTGRTISFGNFLLLPYPLLQKAVHYSEIWSNIASGLLRTKLPFATVETDKGIRYSGKSKMNFTALTLHGLSAIAVFLDVIAIRLLFISLGLILASVVTIVIVFLIKTFTQLAIPGWASSLTSAMLIILLQSFLLSLFTVFLYLSSQSQRQFIPANHYKDYIASVENEQ